MGHSRRHANEREQLAASKRATHKLTGGITPGRFPVATQLNEVSHAGTTRAAHAYLPSVAFIGPAEMGAPIQQLFRTKNIYGRKIVLY